MSADLNSLSLACKQAEARHETAYGLLSMLPSHDPAAPEWAPIWARLRQLGTALSEANTAYLDAIKAKRIAEQRARTERSCPITLLDQFNATTYEVKYIAVPVEGTTANAA